MSPSKPLFEDLGILSTLALKGVLQDTIKDLQVEYHATQALLKSIADGASAEAHFQYAPHEHSSDVTISERAAKLLAPHLPAVKEGRAVALPAGWPAGQPHQAELALDQALWMRPLPELAGYRTPIPGLWLCGQAMHPAVAGVAGYNCAREIERA